MKKLIIKDYELEIKLPSFINIIGLPASGKTYLLRMLINQIENYNIYLDDQPVMELDGEFKKRNIAACLDLNFNTLYVKEEVVFYLEKCGFSSDECFDKLDCFSRYFDMDHIINEKTKDLSTRDKAFIKILSLLIMNPLILGIDKLLTYLNEEQKLKIIRYAKEHKITILNVTSDKEELLLGTEIVILEKALVKKHDKTKVILADEKLLASVGFELPFIINLSNGLNLYELTNKNHYDFKSLVGEVWK